MPRKLLDPFRKVANSTPQQLPLRMLDLPHGAHNELRLALLQVSSRLQRRRLPLERLVHVDGRFVVRGVRKRRQRRAVVFVSRDGGESLDAGEEGSEGPCEVSLDARKIRCDDLHTDLKLFDKGCWL